MATVAAHRPSTNGGPAARATPDPVQRVAGRLLAGLDPLLTHLGEQYCLHVPEYAALGASAIEAEVLPARLSTAIAASYAPVLLDGPDADSRLDALAAAAPAGSLCGPWGRQVLVLVPDGDADVEGLAGSAPDMLIGWAPAAPPGPGLR